MRWARRAQNGAESYAMGTQRAERRGELRDGPAARRTARRATRWTRSAPNGAESDAMGAQRAERRGELRDGRAARGTARTATRWLQATDTAARTGWPTRSTTNRA